MTDEEAVGDAAQGMDVVINAAACMGADDADAGEEGVREAHPAPLIVRAAWLYGAGSLNFASTMALPATNQDRVAVVAEQRGQPTCARDVADGGDATWYDIAREILRLTGYDTGRVLPTTSADSPRRAQRPSYSVLGHAWHRARLTLLRHWRESAAAARSKGF